MTIAKKTWLASGIAASLLTVSGSAMAADTVFSFGYFDLAGQYVQTGVGPTTGTFTADAADAGVLHSNGDVTRLVPPGAGNSASFFPGFVSGFDPANCHVELTVHDLGFGGDPDLALGEGSFLLIDINGDTIAGDIAGFWINLGAGQINFNGDLSNVVLTNPSGDGTFDGNSGSLSTNFGPAFVGDGAFAQLFIGGAGFFGQDFSDVPTQIHGEVVPTPGATALLGLGILGLANGRRRR